MDTTYPTSLMIYLYADEFIAPAHGLFGRAALAPRSGEKVDLKELVIRVYAAAFMDLVDSGVIRLEPLEVKKFLGRETALIAALRPGAAAPQDFLTGQMVDRLLDKRKPEESRVREVIISMVGGRGSTKTPWLQALNPIIGEAVRAGTVQLPEKQPGLMVALFNPIESTRMRVVTAKVEPLRPYALAANGRLDQFLAFQAENGGLLLKEVEDGVNACMDHSSED